MAYGICSEDMAAICITLAGGEIGLSMREVVRYGAAFQQERGDHFGTSDNDFRRCFYLLGVENRIYPLGALGADGRLPAAFDLPLSVWCGHMLRWHDVYFNDEGEHWTRWPQNRYAENRALARAFLRRTATLSARRRLEALAELGWVQGTPARYTERGLWSDDQLDAAERYPSSTIPSRLGEGLRRTRE
jgi:hypothetical protein